MAEPQKPQQPLLPFLMPEEAEVARTLVVDYGMRVPSPVSRLGIVAAAISLFPHHP